MSGADDAIGTVRRTGETVEIVFRRRLVQPLPKVWAAVTTPERISDWFAETSIEGDRIRIRFPAPHGPVEGRIVLNDPMRVFAWTWPNADGSESIVRFDLVPDGEGCVLTLTQSGLRRSEGPGAAAGWHAHLAGLGAAADGIATPWSRVLERESAVRTLYREPRPA